MGDWIDIGGTNGNLRIAAGSSPYAVRVEIAAWTGGAVAAANLPPIALDALIDELYRLKLAWKDESPQID